MKMGLAEMGYPSLSTSLSSCSPIIQWPCCFQSPMLKHTHVPIKMLVSYYHIYYNHIYIYTYIHIYIYIYPMNNECHHSLSPFLLDNIPPFFDGQVPSSRRPLLGTSPAPPHWGRQPAEPGRAARLGEFWFRDDFKMIEFLYGICMLVYMFWIKKVSMKFLCCSRKLEFDWYRWDLCA